MKRNLYIFMSLTAFIMLFQYLPAADPSDSGQKRKREEAESPEERSAKRALTDDAELADRLYEISETFKNQVDDWNYAKVELLKKYQNPEYAHILKIIKDVAPLKIAEELTDQDLQEITEQYLNAIDDLKMRKDTALELLENASFFDIKPIMQAAVQSIAAYLKTEDVLDAFNQGPPSFIETEFSQLANRTGWQEMISTKLLEPFKDALTTRTLPVHADELAYSPNPNDNQIALISKNGLSLWNSHSGQLIMKDWPSPAAISRQTTAPAFSPDGKYLAWTFNKHIAKVWSLPNNRLMFRLAYPEDGIYQIIFSPDSQQLSMIADDDINLWNMQNGKLMHSIYARNDDDDDYELYHIAYSPDGTLLASASGNTIQLWDPIKGERKREIVASNNDYEVHLMKFSPDGRYLATRVESGIKLWNPQDGKLNKEKITKEKITGHYWDDQMVFSPDGRYLVTSNALKKDIELWDLSDSEAEDATRTVVSTHSVDNISFSPDGKVLASLSKNKIELWDPETGELIETFAIEEARRITKIAFSSDSKQIALIYGGDNVILWNLDFNKDIIRRINLEQAIYIYYKFAHPNLLFVSNTKAQKNFKKLYDSLPDVIKRLVPAEEEPMPMPHWPSNEAESSEMATEKQSEELSQTQKERLLEAKEYQDPTEESIEEWMAMYDEAESSSSACSRARQEETESDDDMELG